MPNESNNNRKQGTKRKHYGAATSYNNNSSNTARIPKGQPSILVSCDPAREFKCKREVLEILRHDWEVAVRSSSTDETKLTLDQELAQLQQKTTAEDGPFSAFETGCKGAILIVCTQCKPLVSAPPRTYRKADDGATENSEKRSKTDSNPPDSKPAKSTETTTEASYPAAVNDDRTAVPESKADETVWDSIAAVDRITTEMSKSKSTYPDSRFCTKITPLQTLVYADMDKIEHVVGELVLKHGRDACTFAIRVNRRLGKLTRDEIITSVGLVVAKVAPQWTVHLKTPDVIIWIEIIKTMAGISLLTKPIQNLTTVREQRSNAAKSTDAAL